MLRLLDVEGEGEIPGLPDRDRASVITDLVHDEAGRLTAVVLDDGHRLDVGGRVRFEDGLLVIPDGDARAVFRIEQPDQPPIGVADFAGVEPERVRLIREARDALGLVAQVAVEEARTRKPADLSEVPVIAASILGSLRRARAVADGAWQASLGLDDAAWRQVRADRDPALIQVELAAVEAWHGKAVSMVKRLDEAVARYADGRRPIPAQLEAWSQDIRGFRGGLAKELTRLRGTQ
ncbi:hypothetical protein D7I44_07710 [Gryllotalpicola protaetiae]|uniref:Uncharacterized protein n=1 Tax=Gryllotalpicola protaetiae TaxID=2419771 RepID=A0A387BHX9_9MICO|nr:hypothetical protein D7I44_07710 [Gryllotalpicola protaetiae]